MATTDRPVGRETDPAALAAAIRESDLCHLVARASGDALAAAATLASACDAIGVAYHVAVARTRGGIESRLAAADEAATDLAIGASVPGAASIASTPTSLAAYEVALELGASPDPVVALAGTVAAGETPGAIDSRALDHAALEPRPGVASPTDDPIDGLAYSTLAHAPFSGDEEAARAALAELDLGSEVADDGRRRVASLLALAVGGDPEGTERGSEAIERALRPHAIEGPLATLEGYADVLDALAVEAPGVGLALALGADPGSALSTWREHARAAHAGVGTANTARYDGLLVARIEGPVGTTARLLRDFRSPEPVVLAIDGEEAAIAGVEPIGEAFEAAAGRANADALGNGRRGYAHTREPETLIDAVRGEL